MAGKGAAAPNPGAAYAAYRLGNSWTTRDGEAFVADAPGVIAFLHSCGSAHRLSASDLIRALTDIQSALEFRKGNAYRARSGS